MHRTLPADYPPPSIHEAMFEAARVCVGDEVMDPLGCITRASFDPGLFTGRLDHQEPLHRWQARAAVVALRLAGHLPTEDDEYDAENPEVGECGVVLPGTVPARCGRVGVGRGGDTWDPVCDLVAGHRGPCNFSGEPAQERT